MHLSWALWQNACPWLLKNIVFHISWTAMVLYIKSKLFFKISSTSPSSYIASHIFLLYSFPHIFRPFFPHLKLIFIYLIFFLIFPQHNKTTCVIIEEPAFPHAVFISEKVNVPSIDRRKLIMEAAKKTQNILLTFVLSTESQAWSDKQSINHLMSEREQRRIGNESRIGLLKLF